MSKAMWPEPWPEQARGVPNVALRSALFGVFGKGARRYLEQVQVATTGDAQILYTGQRLDQGDLDVWEAILHLARRQPLGAQCEFTAYQLLRLICKTDTGGNRRTLHRRILRLKATALEMSCNVQGRRVTYIGSLIHDAIQDERTKRYVVVINVAWRPFFEAAHFTYIDWVIRNELDGKPLAQWLHGFYSTHEQPYPLTVQFLHKLSGSDTACMRSFRQLLKHSASEWAHASVRHGSQVDVSLLGDVLHVRHGLRRWRLQHRCENPVEPSTAEPALMQLP